MQFLEAPKYHFFPIFKNLFKEKSGLNQSKEVSCQAPVAHTCKS
jgi:hypothetical protein